MYGRRPLPNVSASLIHELRMVVQQFFGTRQENYYSMKIAEAQAKAQPVMECVFCANPTAANFIIKGFSVCRGHKTKAMGETANG